jgi:hypothetical protein
MSIFLISSIKNSYVRKLLVITNSLADINDSFLGKKKFELDIKSKTPQYVTNPTSHKTYSQEFSPQSIPELSFQIQEWQKFS